MDIPSVASVVCCQVDVSALGRSLVQRSPTDCGASECDHEFWMIMRPWPPSSVEPWQEKKIQRSNSFILAEILH